MGSDALLCLSLIFTIPGKLRIENFSSKNFMFLNIYTCKNQKLTLLQQMFESYSVIERDYTRWLRIIISLEATPLHGWNIADKA